MCLYGYFVGNTPLLFPPPTLEFVTTKKQIFHNQLYSNPSYL